MSSQGHTGARLSGANKRPLGAKPPPQATTKWERFEFTPPAKPKRPESEVVRAMRQARGS